MLRVYARGFGLPTKKVVNMKKQVENIVRHSEVSEKAIEAYLVKRCKESGLLCLKYSNANKTWIIKFGLLAVSRKLTN